MSNSKNSSDFNQIRTERGPNAESESQKLPAGWIRTGQQPDSVAKWNAEYAIPSQAAASGQAQHGVDHGSGQACGGQAIGGQSWWDVMAKPAGAECFPNPTASVFGQKAAEEQKRQLAEAILKLQDKRNRELTAAKVREVAQRAKVARQQSALLDAMAAEAVAPASEMRRDMIDMVRFEALERQVKWLIERGNQHARQISQLLGLVSDLQGRVANLSELLEAAPELRGKTVSMLVVDDPHAGQFSVGPSVAAPSQWRSDVSRRVDEPARTQAPSVPDCEHDMLKANTTVSAITRKKARCNICAQVWESA